MNFLAHIYLSGKDELIQLGNFSGDYVKGTNFTAYPEKVIIGLKMHRTIDNLTDSHHSFLQSKKRLVPVYGRYAGVVVDIFYDHILATTWDSYCATALTPYTRTFYYNMVRNYRHLPKDVKYFLPFIIQSGRLASYATIEGIGEALNIMSRRTSLPNRTEAAIELLEKEYHAFRSEFEILFPFLIESVEETYGIQCGCNAPANDRNLSL